MPAPSTSPAKRPYQAPRLTDAGALGNVTRAILSIGSADGGLLLFLFS